MKKNYSNPKFKLVLLEPNDIVCDSLTMGEGEGTRRAEANQRRGSNIWGDDDE